LKLAPPPKLITRLQQNFCVERCFPGLAFKILGIKQKYGCVYHPQSQGSVERANGVLKTKIAKIMADCNGKLTWVDALPLALMAMRSQTNRLTHLTPHEMLTGRPMPLPQTRGPLEGPAMAQLERELGDYLRALTQIHRLVFQQVKEAHGKDETHIPLDDVGRDPLRLCSLLPLL